MKDYLQKHYEYVEDLMDDKSFQARVLDTINLISDCLLRNGTIYVFGNGGSAADALHISAELVGKYLIDRKAFNVICLNSNTSILTALSNDFDFSTIFSRQLEAHHQHKNAVCWGISTSGNSKNVIEAFKYSKSSGIKTIGLTGQNGGELAEYSDILLNVQCSKTPFIQQLHQIVYHYICEKVEERASFF